jgi:arabinofuranan 3-O-arabinosyltransferase
MPVGVTAESTTLTPRAVWRLREVAFCVVLTAIAFLQAPGKIVPDSKIDLAVNPAGWLERSLHLWEPSGPFGQVQNQAYGYLWPMGPFFMAGDAAGLPGWVMQRLWWALLLCVGFTGVVRLANRLEIGTPAARLIAAAAFALSPRLLTELGALSVEAWPTAVAPWVLVPLVGLAKGASVRRSVTLSALAVACAGGVNATAVFAVVPLAVLWLFTLAPARRRMVALAAWSLAVLCATAWWLIPLFILGRFSPPFLDFIENASATTGITDPVTNLRGASHWVAYLTGPFGPSLPAGWRLATEPLLVGGSVVVAALGVAGLSRRGLPHRRFLVCGVALGMALVGLGHIGDIPGTFAGAQREFLDGFGAPLRNVHKFDVLIRLPLALGLAHLLGVFARVGAVSRRGFRYAPVPAALVTATAVGAVAIVALPAITADLAPKGGFTAVPRYWHQAADWFNERLDQERVLVIPGARFPHYTWGDTLEEITQPLLTTSWAVRNAIPLTPPATIRLLDAVESALATGDGSAGLADLLARSGVRYLLVRSDLNYGRSGTIQPLIVRQALERTPGLSYVTGFGPTVGAELSTLGYIDQGLGIQRRALEVYQVNRPVRPVAAYDMADVRTVVGGTESLLDLAAAGQLTAAPTILAGDLPPDTGLRRAVVTDGMRRRDVSFGRGRDSVSATLTVHEAEGGPRPARDYIPEWGRHLATTVEYRGVRSISASSSWAQARIAVGSRPQHHPFAAFDGDPTTSWRPAPGRQVAGQWIQVEFEGARTVPEITVMFDGTAGSLPTRISVDAGTERVAALTFGPSVVVKLPGVHATRTLRVNIEQFLSSAPGGVPGIAEIQIDDVRAERTLVIPEPPGSAAAESVVLTAAPSVPSCFFVNDRPRCSRSVARSSEDGDRIDRILAMPAAGTYAPTIWARPRPGYWLDTTLDQEAAKEAGNGSAATVVASSIAVDDPAGRPGAVLDGDPATAWMPAANDEAPMLRLTWSEARTITGVRLTLDPRVAATRPGAVRVVGDGAMAGGFLNGDGDLYFAEPMTTDTLTIFFLDSPRAPSFDPYTIRSQLLQIAVGEVTVFPGEAKRPINLAVPVPLDCGSGPTLQVGTRAIQTRLVVTRRDLLERREVMATPCGDDAAEPVFLPSGRVRIIASASGLSYPSRLALVSGPARAAPSEAGVEVSQWSVTHRRLTLAPHPRDRLLVVRENTNPGWRAVAGGQVLRPIIVDGWQQGWLVPSGVSGTVEIRFWPDAAYRAGLLGGAALLLAVFVVAVLPARRRGSHARSVEWVRRRTGRVLPFVVGGGALIALAGYLGVAVALAAIVVSAYRAQVPRRSAERLSRPLELWLPAILLLVGGWLTLTMDDRYRAALPHLAGFLTVALLWFWSSLPSTRPLPARPRDAVTPALDRTLNDVVAQRGQDESAGHRDREQPQGVRPERWTLEVVGKIDHDDVPQEQAVGHGADPAKARMFEHPVE